MTILKTCHCKWFLFQTVITMYACIPCITETFVTFVKLKFYNKMFRKEKRNEGKKPQKNPDEHSICSKRDRMLRILEGHLKGKRRREKSCNLEGVCVFLFLFLRVG